MKPEFVSIKVERMQANYFRTLPFHASQEDIEKTDGYSVFRYFLTPDYDFKQDVLSFGTSIEVMEPEHLRDELAGIASELNARYSK